MAAVVLAVVVLAISLLCAQRQKSRMRPAPEAVKTKKQHVASAECEQEHEDGDAPAERNFNARFSERRPLALSSAGGIGVIVAIDEQQYGGACGDGAASWDRIVPSEQGMARF